MCAKRPSGVWYVDASLLLWHGVAATAVGGEIISHSSTPPDVRMSKAINGDGSTTFTTTGLAQLSVSGKVCLESVCTLTSIETALFSRNSNTESSTKQRTVFALVAKTIINTTDEKSGLLIAQRISEHQYPMDMALYQPNVPNRTVIQANITFVCISGSICDGKQKIILTEILPLQARGRTETWTISGSTHVISWQNAMSGEAVLNHTNTTPRTYGPERSTTNASMSVVLSSRATDKPCYSFSLRAEDGVVVGDTSASSLRPVSESCTGLPSGTRFCGLEVCGEPTAENERIKVE